MLFGDADFILFFFLNIFRHVTLQRLQVRISRQILRNMQIRLLVFIIFVMQDLAYVNPTIAFLNIFLALPTCPYQLGWKCEKINLLAHFAKSVIVLLKHDHH